MKPAPSLTLRLITGILLVAATTALYRWQKPLPLSDIKIINSAAISLAGYALSALSINKLLYFPGRQSWLNILPTVGIAYSSVFGIAALFFVTFSNSFVLSNGILTALFFPHANWLRLDQAQLPHNSVQAIVADLHSPDLGATWQRFLADCTLHNIPVYNIRQIEESLTGRVKIRHLYENDLGSLLPPPAYMLIKRIMDIALIIISLPLTLPLMCLTALAVVLESRGGALFTQNRIGQGGREFTIYKFRSMAKNSEAHGAQLAQIGDARVTRVGKFIRKTRLDELPQFWNILRGDMSLIGPRPEQRVFVEQFNDSIPFYNYRHIVKPGLSGWAQVTQGYAGNEDETQIKLEHDFYYIKHFSLSLDILIIFKTIKTILTGFGAR